MLPGKKQLEVLLIHYFRECYPDFPKGKIIHSESPDFIVSVEKRNKTGIELTKFQRVFLLDMIKSNVIQLI